MLNEPHISSKKNAAQKALVWLNRPEEDSSYTAHKLQHLGVSSIISPVMDVSALPHTPLLADKVDAVIITSKYALLALDEIARITPVFAVGKSLCERLKTLGFLHVHDYATASALVRDVPRYVPLKSRIAYVRGEVIRLDIASILQSLRYNVQEITCYKAQAANVLKEEILQPLQMAKTPILVPFYAIQAVQFASKILALYDLSHVKTQLTALCISKTVADYAKKSDFGHVWVSDEPNGNSMHALIAAHALPENEEATLHG